jgi:uncharacterized low-complexity protein
MRIAKIVLIALASSVAIASVQAATLSSAHQKSESVLELIKKKKKDKKKKDKAGHCGEYKFFSKKDKKCVDARKAKKS